MIYENYQSGHNHDNSCKDENEIINFITPEGLEYFSQSLLNPQIWLSKCYL